MKNLRMAMAQMNPKVGDIAGNMNKIKDIVVNTTDVDLIVFPECVLTGYPVEDLVNRNAFMQTVMNAIEDIKNFVKENHSSAIVFGTPFLLGADVYNAAVFIDPNGNMQVRFKSELPNYDVFDEVRNFKRGLLYENTPIMYNEFDIGILICEDIWFPRVAENLYRGGADFFISINGSPFCTGKDDLRKKVVLDRANECKNTPIFYLNMVGGQDEIVFDGASFIVDGNANIINQFASFDEVVQLVNLTKNGKNIDITTNVDTVEYPGEVEAVYRALMLSIRDYVGKNNFPGVLFGLSGGIDSALVAAITTDALGPDKTWAIRMPSKFTSDESNDLALDQCKRMGIQCDTIAIGGPVSVIEGNINNINPPFINRDPKKLTEENLQARERGQTLMALSNRYGFMVVATANRTESALGYSTLGGDLCGGFAIIKDVYKTMVFALSEWRNNNIPYGSRLQVNNIIPERVISRPPTAELKDGQTDEASLMPYKYLDVLLFEMIEREQNNDQIARVLVGKFGNARNWSNDVVRMRRLLDYSEFKRRQAPIGTKITTKSFGKGRRYPITNGFREE